MVDLGSGVLESRKLKEANSQQQIKHAIQRGEFTPFLGAGASSLRPWDLELEEPNLNEPPWREIWGALIAISRCLKPNSDRAYLASFARQRLKISPKRVKLLEAGAYEVDQPTAWPGDSLLQFQCDLVRLSALFSRCLGVLLSQMPTSVERFGDFELRTKEMTTDLELLISLLVNLIDCAKGLPTADLPASAHNQEYRKPPMLQRVGIYERLLILAHEIVPYDLWMEEKFRARLGKHAQAIEDLPDECVDRSSDVVLRAAVLEWLPELLWYTLRFWSPSLPTTAEMAFELSLKAVIAPPRKVELAQAAEAVHSPQTLTSHIRDWFLYCHAARPALNHFYVAMAAILQHAFDVYDRQESARREEELGVEPAAERRETAAYIPIAFTTNFDKCLEHVFRRMDIVFHTLYPVRRRPRMEPPSQARNESIPSGIEWRFCTHYPEGGKKGRFDGRENIVCSDFFQDDKQVPMLEGPVIVKLHGSPLDFVSGTEEHWLVLSELGYLEALDSRQQKSLPKWIETQLAGSTGEANSEGERSLWFLGYSVSDWNVRLRLYEHLRYSRYAQRKVGRQAVDRQCDSIRMALLGTLEVKVFVGDLNYLPRVVARALEEIPERQRSEALQRLLDWLRRNGVHEQDH